MCVVCVCLPAQCGADALRMSLLSYVQPGDNAQINLDPKRSEHYRLFANKLWNAARFVLSHLWGADTTAGSTGTAARAVWRSLRQQGQGPASLLPDVRELPMGERWILSRLAHTSTTVQDCMRTFDMAGAVGAVRV